MNRRSILSLAALSPLALISAKVSKERTIVNSLVRRWRKSKAYTALVLEAMPAEFLEFRPTAQQMSFAQHFMHLGYTNNMFIGLMMDTKTYADYGALKEAEFFLPPPDPINVFQPDTLAKRVPEDNKTLVSRYLADTFDYVISSLEQIDDSNLTRGEDKEKPWYVQGHTHLDLILRGESHTAHHRAQAICYLRMKGIQPPGYSKNNTL